MRTWQVDDVMTREVATVGEETPYRAIVDVLIRRGISAVPVVDGFRRVLGVVSEADLLHKVEHSGAQEERRVFAGRRRRVSREKAEALLAAGFTIDCYEETPGWWPTMQAAYQGVLDAANILGQEMGAVAIAALTLEMTATLEIEPYRRRVFALSTRA